MLGKMNILGQTIQEYKLNVGINQVEIDLTNLPAGLYTYSLQANGKIMATKRLSVNK
jgi:hypothetical protein